MNAKSLVACAALLLGVAFVAPQATAAGVQSDIVGYTTINLKAGFNLLGLPFQNLKTDSTAVPVQNVMQGSFVDGDLIQYWDGSKLNTLTYTEEDADFEIKAGWYGSADKEPSALTFKPGDAFWVHVKAPKSVTLAGKVAEGIDATTVKTTTKGFNLIASPTPKTYKVSNIVFEGITEGDLIQYWNGKTLMTLTYTAEDAAFEIKAGWYGPADSEPSTIEIQAAQGFWLYTPNSTVNVKFN